MTDGADAPGEDIGRLLSAVRAWTQRTMPAPPSGHGGPECQWCPLCQLASALRGEHPELTERMAEAGAAVAGAIRALLDSTVASEPTSEEPTPKKPPQQRPRVQRIKLDDPAAGPSTRPSAGPSTGPSTAAVD